MYTFPDIWSATCFSRFLGMSQRNNPVIGVLRKVKDLWTAKVDDNLVKMVEILQVALKHLTWKKKNEGGESPEKALSPKTVGGGSAMEGAWLQGSRK